LGSSSTSVIRDLLDLTDGVTEGERRCAEGKFAPSAAFTDRNPLQTIKCEPGVAVKCFKALEAIVKMQAIPAGGLDMMAAFVANSQRFYRRTQFCK
jgi:hypothetical protein